MVTISTYLLILIRLCTRQYHPYLSATVFYVMSSHSKYGKYMVNMVEEKKKYI
jgi:hypothetical protein